MSSILITPINLNRGTTIINNTFQIRVFKMDEEELFRKIELAKKIVLIEDRELFQELAQNNIQQRGLQNLEGASAKSNLAVAPRPAGYPVKSFRTEVSEQESNAPTKVDVDNKYEGMDYIPLTNPMLDMVSRIDEDVPQVIADDNQSVMSQEVTSPVPVEKCSRCNNKRKIYSGGQCKSCYNYLHLNKEQHKFNVAKWLSKHPHYSRDLWRLKHLK